MLGKIEGRKRRWLDGITDSTDKNFGKLWVIVVRTGKPGMPQSVGSRRDSCHLATEQQQLDLKHKEYCLQHKYPTGILPVEEEKLKGK